jgi:arylsulfatase A-like enzyme
LESKPERELIKKRRLYDEFILYVDYEFDRLYRGLEASGLLENTYLVLTSDHGEMFERGILGHMTPSLHQPVIHTPLVIFPPGQKSRIDVAESTSAIDLLPTLASVSGVKIPSWAEGRVLPPFGPSTPSLSRDVFAVQMEEIGRNNSIARGTVMMVRGWHKLIWYFGYPELGSDQEMVELYDLRADPQELQNLAIEGGGLTDQLLEAAKTKLAEMDQGDI